MTLCLSATHVSKIYGSGDVAVKVLDDLSIDLLPGEKIAIVGGSGAGKSTLLNILGGLDQPTTGLLIGLVALTRSIWPNQCVGETTLMQHSISTTRSAHQGDLTGSS